MRESGRGWSVATALVGRDAETAVLESLLDGASAEVPAGGSVLIRGEPGIGKSALLEAVVSGAAERGMRVFSCSGVAGEARLAFAGLHQMLWPVRKDADALPARQREAVLAALGLVDAPTPGIFLVGLATLELFAECARRAPVLVVADDVQWLDQPTCEVLAFVGGRLDADPVVLVAARRDGEGDGDPLGAAGLRELPLEPLGAAAAAALLDSHAPLDPPVRQRVLDDAAGNPLALLELPVALRDRGGGADLPPWLPLTARLERAFAARLTGLPQACRAALLAVALDDGDAVAEALAAASRVAGAQLSAADLAPAAAAGLVEVDADRVRFRHPLVGSAVRQAASLAQRQEMHGALAEVLATAPDRRIWHRAAATVGPDEDVAAELEQAAARALRRGGASTAAAALQRAARLSRDPTRRGHLLLRAVYEVYGLGQPQAAARLLDEADRLDLDPADRSWLRWMREILGPAARSGTQSLGAFADAADRMQRDGDTDRALEALERVAVRCWWSNPDPRVYRRMAAVAEATTAAEDDPRLLFIQAMTDPVGRGPVVVQRLRRLRPGTGSPIRDYHLGFAAVAVGACEQAAGFHAAAASGQREQGQLGVLGQTLLAQAWTAVLLGQSDLAAAAADESGRVLAETGNQFWVTGAQLVLAVVAGRRGDVATAANLAGRAERVLLTAGVPPMLAQVQLARGIAALGAGRFGAAYQQLARIFDPDDTAYHPHLRSWALVDLADAASHSGDQAVARARHAELLPLAAASPLLAASLAVAAAMLAAADAAAAAFEEALGADLTAWPLHRARLLLAYGSWLRRRRRAVDARGPLRAARDLFDTLGALVGGERARQELHASGEESGQRAPGVLDRLSPQEWHITRLAAEGLTNREIGQQLYLSHRTISNHLYRVFPKLGITSRAELAAIVTGLGAGAGLRR